MGFTNGVIAGFTETDVLFYELTEYYHVIVALPVTFWAFYSTLNGKYERFDIILSAKANSGDRRDE